MRNQWPAITIALAFSAGLLLAPATALAQDDQQQSEQKKKEQEAKKEEQKKKEQQTQETVGTMLQRQQQPQKQQPPKPQPKPSPQPQPAPPPQWQQPRSHHDLPQLDNRPRRLPPDRQRDLITQQRQRQNEYDLYLQNQQRELERRSMNLQRQHREAQYRYHRDYLDRLRDQRTRIGGHHDFDHDPFFSAAPSYRYRRSGHWYDVNEYAAALLQDAVSYGYEEGYRAGAADRADGWRYECEISYVYQDANYGFEGLYVSADEYHYYFRQGFRRGYEDGYYGRHRYGIEHDGSVRIMTDVLRLIIDLRVLR